jgi:voltage-gated potassium channel
MGTSRRLATALAALGVVLVLGTIGYRLFGLSWLDALYQTATTVTTVGFREVEPFDAGAKLFTIVLVLAGVGTVLYTLGTLLEFLVEGHLAQLVGRRRMDRRIAGLSGHIVLCGLGRVGRSIAGYLAESRAPVVAVELDQARAAQVDLPVVLGDATNDEVLRMAGVERASALVAALTTDADNLFVTLSGRALNPGLFIIARAREGSAVDKLTRAGADRVVNPQEIGGARIAAFLTRPHVASFVDVVMHERPLEFRLEEVSVGPASPLAGRSVSELPGGAQVLAVRRVDGSFATKPKPEMLVGVGQVLIAVGTEEELAELVAAAG